MKQDNFYRHGIFALALVGLVGAAAVSGNSGSSLIPYDDDDDRPSQNAISETRDLESFSRIEVRGAIDLDLKAGGTQSVSVEASDNRLSHVETRVVDGKLIIDMDKSRKRNFWRDADVNISITVAQLKGLEVLGAVDGKLTGLKDNDLLVEIKGAADLDISGSCSTLTLDVKGAGEIDADKLECQTVDVDVKGAGSASVYASESVDAKVSGVGSISVYGSPANVSKRVGGIGAIDIN